MINEEKLFYQTFEGCLKVVSLYSCPDDCSFCCRYTDISFGKSDYRHIQKKYPEMLKILKQNTKHEVLQTKKGLLDEYIFSEHPCPMLKNDLCSIQNAKPFICKLYPFDVKADRKDYVSIDPCPVGKLIIIDYFTLNSTHIAFDDSRPEEERNKEIQKNALTIVKILRKSKEMKANSITAMAFVPLENMMPMYEFLKRTPKELIDEKRKVIFDAVDDPDVEIE